MEKAIKTEVAIIGAGPTGLSLACQFIRYGVDFVIIDKKDGITKFSKALGVHARTLEIYEQIGLANTAVSQGIIAGKARILEGGEIRGEVNLSEVGEGLSPYPFMLVFEQSKNEKLLYEYLQTHSRKVLWQTELENFSQDENLVIANIKRANGETQTIEAKYLVGCDGAKSPVRHQLNLKFEGSTFERIFYVADAKVEWKFSHDALHVCLAKHSVVAFFPMPGENRFRIVGAFPEEFSKSEGEVLYEEIEQRIKEETQIDLDISQVNWFSTYKVHSRHVESFRQGRVFLAGDSAHVHTPAGGQGMNTGIQDGYNLAWKLSWVLQGKTNEKILDSYNSERVENARNLIKTTDRMFNFLAGDAWFTNLIRDHIFPRLAETALSLKAVRKEFFRTISQIGINYRNHALSMHNVERNFKIRSGDRCPYFLVEGVSSYEKLKNPQFHLIIFSDGESDFQSLRNELENDLTDFNLIPLYPHITEIFGSEKSFMVLLRPDNYIAFISSEISAEKVKSYFKEKLSA